MPQIKGIGGIFFKSKDPEVLNDWYQKHLGIPTSKDGAVLSWRRDDDPEKKEMTVWSVFSDTTRYFEPGEASFMINYIVDDLDAALTELRGAGVEVEKSEDSDFGKFGWLADPDGNRIELWEPPKTPKPD